ncbi:MAG: hypothetical protein PF440_04005 [Thiomicrorhabdus sp.]|jgi:hypothetical protein|nr:hypothetical protein [Thiomicrorhabdus sp.]
MSRRKRSNKNKTRKKNREVSEQKLQENIKGAAMSATPSPSDIDHEPKRHQFIETIELNCELTNQITECAKFYTNNDSNGTFELVSPTTPYIDLAALMIQATKSKGIYLNFSWPIGFEWVGLAHALACRTLSKETLGKHKLRMSLYPSVLSNYGRYKNTKYPYLSFLEEAKSAAAISTSLSLRHLVYMHLNQAKEVDDPRRNPALENSISLFEWNQDDSSWEIHGDGYFSDISVVLHHYPGRTQGHKAQIASYSSKMADPSESNEAVFRIKRNTKPATARKIILDYKENCDLIVIDSRQNLLKGISGWRNALSKLVEQVVKDERAPSLLLLVDEPSVYKFFHHTFLKIYNDNKKSALSKKFYKHHWMRRSNNLWKDTAPENSLPSEIWAGLEVKVTDAQSLFDIRKLNDIANGVLQKAPELALELRRSAGFLRRIVDMPVGQDTLTRWVQESSSDWSETRASSMASRYLWRHYKLHLISRMSNVFPGGSSTIDKYINIADSIYDRIKESTSIQREIINTLCRLSSESNRTAIFVEEFKYVSLVEGAIKKNDDTNGLEGISVRSGALSDDYTKYDTFIIAGIGKVRLSDFIFSSKLPPNITLICDAYSAWSIQLDLSFLKSIPEFTAIHPRIDLLISLLEPQIESFKLAGQYFELPTELPIHMQQYDYQYDISDPYAMIHLAGYGVLPVAEHSSLIKANIGNQPPYYAVTTKDITEGDQLLVLGEDQRERISALLKVQGSRLTRNATTLLIAYFSLAKEAIERNYPQRHRTDRSRSLLQKMKLLENEILGEVHEGMVLRWMKHIEEFDIKKISIEINELKTMSPRKKNHFIFFARALGFDQISASNYWNKGISQLRIGRILEGRQLSNEITRLLTGTMEINDLNMSDHDTEFLFDIANKCTYPIEMIISKEDLDEEQQ